MAIGRTERFDDLKPRVVSLFGSDPKRIATVAHIFELLEMAWHDCYAELTPPPDVVDAVLLCSEGTLDGLIAATRLAVIDRRDLLVWAADLRNDSA